VSITNKQGRAFSPAGWAAALSGMLLFGDAPAHAVNSQCYGTVGHGYIENSVEMPANGPNFEAYSSAARSLGRTYVHSEVAEIVSAAYAAVAITDPDISFVYGETGWSSGGQMRPHHTHQNGLSVDFFVPIRDKSGRSIPMPTGAIEKFGYGVSFDDQGKNENFEIDFAAVAEHIYQLDVAAKAHGVGLSLVIFDLRYLPKLFATARGPYLKDHIPFMKGKPWIRHDQHYHVDFAIPCKRYAK
jgi:penicillin-insensitive murein endopeptidase